PGGHVHEHDHHSVNLVVQRAIGKDAELVTLPVSIGDLSFQGPQTRHYLCGHRLEFRNCDRGVDVQQWPPYVAGDEPQDFLRFRCEAADGEIPADHDHRNIDA